MSTGRERRLAFDDPAATWTRDPVGISHHDNRMTVEAAEASDWWRDTAYGFRHDNGHALLLPWEADTAVEVAVDLTGFTEEFDQAGLFIVVNDSTWVKAGVEFADGHPQLGAVVTNGSSDWSTGRWEDAASAVVRIRASRFADAIVIRARLESDTDWRLVRVARFPHADARIGPMVCAPSRPGLRATFTDWRVTAPDAGLHD